MRVVCDGLPSCLQTYKPASSSGVSRDEREDRAMVFSRETSGYEAAYKPSSMSELKFLLLLLLLVLVRLVIFIAKIVLIKVVFPLLGITLQSPASHGSKHTKHKNNKIIKSE